MSRIVWLLCALILAAAAPAGAKPFQRLVLAPGCYVLAPGGTYDVSAYCLDESTPAPAPGTVLASAPESLGQTVIKIGNAAASLQTALKRGTISLEGLGGADYFHIRVRNLTADKIEICVTSPTVLLGDDGYPTTDLKKLYPLLAPMMKEAGGAAPASGNQELETHLKIQKQIWEAMANLKAAADRNGADGLLFGQTAGQAASRDCVGPPNTVVLCPER
jgi:hypothetical protein